jgi:nucleotide-binding universal stress UspA family protein
MSSNHLRPILVAVADDRDAGLRYAAAEAVRERRPLRIVHVVAPPRVLDGASPESVLLSFEAAEILAEHLLHTQQERALAIVDGQVPVETSLQRGGVVEVLLGLSEDADHIVLLHRREERLSSRLTGSTAIALAAVATVPVITVPEVWAGPRGAAHVTVGLGEQDLDDAEALLERGLLEAAARGATLTVVHAWYQPAEYGELVMGRLTREVSQQVARTGIEDRLSGWREAHPLVDTRVEVAHVRPIDGLLRASGHSDVLIVGRGRPRTTVHLGSVARALVRESLCPVLVLGTPEGKRGRCLEAPAAASS